MGNYISVNGVYSRMNKTRVYQLFPDYTGDQIFNFVNEIIDRAESTIDGFASTRWVIPLPKSAMADEWAYRIVEYEIMKGSAGGDVPLKYKDSYEMTMKILAMMGDGKYEPRGATQLSASTTVGHSVDFYSDTPMFTQCQMDGY